MTAGQTEAVSLTDMMAGQMDDTVSLTDMTAGLTDTDRKFDRHDGRSD